MQPPTLATFFKEVSAVCSGAACLKFVLGFAFCTYTLLRLSSGVMYFFPAAVSCSPQKPV